MEALAILSQMAGQLGQEAADAYDKDRWYAANALTRQIVEAHYLMAHFRDDPNQRVRWLKASDNRIEKSFRPGQMRQAGGFRVEEYKQHCAWGGHPNPSARWLLPNHAHGPIAPDALAADLAMHLVETVVLFADVLVTVPNALAYVKLVPDQGDLPAVVDVWRESDPLSVRYEIPRAAPTVEDGGGGA